MRKGLLQVSNFTEDAVAMAIDSFLSIASFPNLRYSVEPFSRSKERWLGADARVLDQITGIKPFYMQFKRPYAYPSSSKSRIILDRKNMEFPRFSGHRGYAAGLVAAD